MHGGASVLLRDLRRPEQLLIYLRTHELGANESVTCTKADLELRSRRTPYTWPLLSGSDDCCAVPKLVYGADLVVHSADLRNSLIRAKGGERKA
jgi:hypothetical protein